MAEVVLEPEKGIKNGLYIFHLIDSNNRIIWQMTSEEEYEGRGSAKPFISDKNGTVVFFQNPYTFDMFDSTGHLLRRINMFNKEYDYNFSLGRP